MTAQTGIPLFNPGDIIKHRITGAEAVIVRMKDEEYHVSFDENGVRNYVKDYVEIAWELKPNK